MQEELCFYDGRDKVNAQDDNSLEEVPSFQLTDEIRKNISGNPFTIK